MNQNIPRNGNTLSGQSFRQGLLAAGAGTGMFVTPPTPRPTQAQVDAYNRSYTNAPQQPPITQIPKVRDTLDGQQPYIANGRPIVYPSGVEETPPPPPAPILTQSTGRRDEAPLSTPKPILSDNRIGMGEALMRIGGAGLGGSREGGLASLSAMTDMYGQIEDYNRSAQVKAEEAASLAKYRQGLVDAKMAKIEADQQKGMAGNVISDPLAYTTPTITAIDSVLTKLDQEGTWLWPFNDVSGVTGAIMSAVPGTPAHDVKMDIQTIQAAVGFDRLQAMRDASPTGGALGQVSEMELKQLNASLGSLAQSQSAAQFRQRLEAVKRHYVGAVNAIRNQQLAYNAGVRGSSASTFSDPDADKFSEADAIVNNS